MKPIKIAITTLGCKVNQDESAGIEQLFTNAGHDIVNFSEHADVYIVNTCTVTHLGSRKSRQLLRQARRRNNAACVVALGCYPQTASGELSEMAEVDLVVGNSHKREIVNIVEKAIQGNQRRVVVHPLESFDELPVAVTASRHRATLKIQEGCQRFCTYCIVPMARGGLRSMPVAQVVERAQELAAKGYGEIVLTGINLTSYGRETVDGRSLAAVIRALDVLPVDVRVRISSVEPTDFNADLIDAIAGNPRVCKHFHIPLQSGSDNILRRMGRKYQRKDYLDLIAGLKNKFNKPSFSTDIIVGFPGESDADFLQTVELVEAVEFCKLHVFRFSARQGTPAAKFKEQIAPQLKNSRSEILIDAGHGSALRYANSLVGFEESVLIEEPSPVDEGYMVGYGERYVRIHCAAEAEPGSILPVKITSQFNGELKGQMV